MRWGALRGQATHVRATARGTDSANHGGRGTAQLARPSSRLTDGVRLAARRADSAGGAADDLLDAGRGVERAAALQRRAGSTTAARQAGARVSIGGFGGCCRPRAHSAARRANDASAAHHRLPARTPHRPRGCTTHRRGRREGTNCTLQHGGVAPGSLLARTAEMIPGIMRPGEALARRGLPNVARAALCVCGTATRAREAATRCPHSLSFPAWCRRR